MEAPPHSEGAGSVGIIRSPVRAIALLDGHGWPIMPQTAVPINGRADWANYVEQVMITNRFGTLLSEDLRSVAGALACLIVALAALTGPASPAGEQGSATRPAMQRRGFYLHACWTYNYPFAVRAWKRADYQDMFRMLQHLGYNSVMLWPVLEAVPLLLSPADREAVRAFRPIIEDAQKCGLETWLTFCVESSLPEIAARPWLERSLYSHRKTIRLDDPNEAAAYCNTGRRCWRSSTTSMPT